MKKLIGLFAAVAFFASTAAFAQSAKVTAKVGSIIQVDADTNSSPSGLGPWQNILSNTLHTSQQKDLFVSVSLECGLLTDTLVRSKNGTSDTSVAAAAVQTRVIVDQGTARERIFEPGIINYCRRTQTLTAQFSGLNCTADLVTGAVTCADPESLQLILDTMNANAFNFVLDQLGSGDHTVQVQARTDLGITSQQGSARARAYVGKGAVTVEEVRMIKGEDFTL